MTKQIRKFNVGDTVMLIENYPDDNDELVEGDVGTVVGYMDDYNWVRVDWGRDISGHDCDGTCEDGQGWNCKESWLMLMQENEFEPCTFEELIELIGA